MAISRRQNGQALLILMSHCARDSNCHVLTKHSKFFILLFKGYCVQGLTEIQYVSKLLQLNFRLKFCLNLGQCQSGTLAVYIRFVYWGKMLTNDLYLCIVLSGAMSLSKLRSFR